MDPRQSMKFVAICVLGITGLVAVFAVTKGKTQAPPDGKGGRDLCRAAGPAGKGAGGGACGRQGRNEKLRIVSDALGLATEAADADEYALGAATGEFGRFGGSWGRIRTCPPTSPR